MKKVLVLTLVAVFALSTVSFAGGQGSCKLDGKAVSKTIEDPTIQAAADHIALWGKSSAQAKQEKLDGDTNCARKKNRGGGSWL